MLIFFVILFVACGAILYRWKNQEPGRYSSLCCQHHHRSLAYACWRTAKKEGDDDHEKGQQNIGEGPDHDNHSQAEDPDQLECKFMRVGPDLPSESWLGDACAGGDGEDGGEEEEGQKEGEEEKEEVWVEHRKGPDGQEVLTVRRRRWRRGGELLITASIADNTRFRPGRGVRVIPGMRQA